MNDTRQYFCQYPFINVFHKKNGGVAAARNIDIGTTSGEWLYFVDSDDWLMENAIPNICRRPNADMILFDAYKNNGNSKVPWEHFHKTPLAAPWDKVFSHSFTSVKTYDTIFAIRLLMACDLEPLLYEKYCIIQPERL